MGTPLCTCVMTAAVKCGCGVVCQGYKGAAQHVKLTGCKRLREGNYEKVLYGHTKTQPSHDTAAAVATAATSRQAAGPQQIRTDTDAATDPVQQHHQLEPDNRQQDLTGQGGHRADNRDVPDRLRLRWSVLKQSRQAAAAAPRITDRNRVPDYEILIQSEEVRDITAVMLELSRKYRLKLIKHYPPGHLPYSTLAEFNAFVQPDQVRTSNTESARQSTQQELCVTD